MRAAGLAEAFVPPRSSKAGHIPGAVSVPLVELAKRLAGLPRRKEVVAYCRGPYCVLAVEAVDLLRKKGFKAVRLADGVLDWTAWQGSRGHPDRAPRKLASLSFEMG
jgi:rhodanese-related sulfurtransferase